MRDIFDRFVIGIECVGIEGVEVQVNYPTIILKGDRDHLTTFVSEILLWSRDIDYITNSIDYFDMALDFEGGYVVFFAKSKKSSI